MSTADLLLIIFGMFAVTFPVRFIPLVACNRLKVPRFLKIWLGYVPVTIFSALLVQIFYRPGKATDQYFTEWPLFASCLVSLIVTMKTKSIGWGIGSGFALFLVLMMFVI